MTPIEKEELKDLEKYEPLEEHVWDYDPENCDSYCAQCGKPYTDDNAKGHCSFNDAADRLIP